MSPGARTEPASRPRGLHRPYPAAGNGLQGDVWEVRLHTRKEKNGCRTRRKLDKAGRRQSQVARFVNQ